MPHTVREIINHEITHLAQKCEHDKVPYLWDCLGVLYRTAVIGDQCTDHDMKKLKSGINEESTIGKDFLSSLENIEEGTYNYGILEKFASCWVERMSEVITDVLRNSLHLNDLGLKDYGENVDNLKRLFQKEIRGNVTRMEYTLTPYTDARMRLGGFFGSGKNKWNREAVASAMFDHNNVPFSGTIQDNRFTRNNTPAAIFILSQFLLWSRFCKEDHLHLIKLFSSSITEYLQIRTGNRLDAMRWTMNYYHNVVDSVQCSYNYWKKYYFVHDQNSNYPIQNNPALVIHLCLLGSAIET